MKRNVVSVAISLITLLIGAATMLSSRGSGMERGLSSAFFLIIYGSISLTLAFAFALAAMMRGEEPILLTLIAFVVPPLLGVIAIIRH
jgi:hypothetical protein